MRLSPVRALRGEGAEGAAPRPHTGPGVGALSERTRWSGGAARHPQVP